MEGWHTHSNSKCSKLHGKDKNFRRSSSREAKPSLRRQRSAELSRQGTTPTPHGDHKCLTSGSPPASAFSRAGTSCLNSGRTAGSALQPAAMISRTCAGHPLPKGQRLEPRHASGTEQVAR